MYVIFYNCYFHKYLRSYLPKWVITDVQSLNKEVKQTARTNADSKVSRHTSMEKSCRTAVSKKKFNLASTNLADSILLLNERVEEQV
jgi:predicted transcriptional regulator